MPEKVSFEIDKLLFGKFLTKRKKRKRCGTAKKITPRIQNKTLSGDATKEKKLTTAQIEATKE